MRICILGAGALGSTIGGVLAEGGHEVTLIARNPAHVAAINARGLRLRTDGVERVVRLAAAVDAAGMAPVDLVLVLVKSRDTEAAMRAATNLVGADTIVLSLQNGLGQEETLAAIVGARPVLAGKTYAGGVMLAPGSVVCGVAGKETVIGEIDGGLSPRAIALAGALTASGVTTIVSPNILGAMWDKLLVNVATGALAAATGLPYGDLYAVPEIEATALAAVREAMAVARARGVTLETVDPRDAWLKAAAGLPGGFKTSMLQSLEKGSPTEIDAINGAVVRAGAQVGAPTPVNATLVAVIKGLERRLAADAPPRAASASAYLEHAAIRVRDLAWHVRFFEAVMGWRVRQIDGDPDDPKQVWIGGAQLIRAPQFDGAAGRLDHFGLRCADVEAAMAAAYAFDGVQADPRGRNWLTLPEGLVVELLPASAAATTAAARIHPEL